MAEENKGGLPMSRKCLLSLLIVAFLAAACASKQTPAPPTATLTPAPTAAPTITPSPTPTPIPIPEEVTAFEQFLDEAGLPYKVQSDEEGNWTFTALRNGESCTLRPNSVGLILVADKDHLYQWRKREGEWSEIDFSNPETYPEELLANYATLNSEMEAGKTYENTPAYQQELHEQVTLIKQMVVSSHWDELGPIYEKVDINSPEQLSDKLLTILFHLYEPYAPFDPVLARDLLSDPANFFPDAEEGKIGENWKPYPGSVSHGRHFIKKEGEPGYEEYVNKMVNVWSVLEGDNINIFGVETKTGGWVNFGLSDYLIGFEVIPGENDILVGDYFSPPNPNFQQFRESWNQPSLLPQMILLSKIDKNDPRITYFGAVNYNDPIIEYPSSEVVDTETLKFGPTRQNMTLLHLDTNRVNQEYLENLLFQWVFAEVRPGKFTLTTGESINAVCIFINGIVPADYISSAPWSKEPINLFEMIKENPTLTTPTENGN